MANTTKTSEKTKLFRADQGVKSFPADQVKNLVLKGEWLIPTDKQLKAEVK